MTARHLTYSAPQFTGLKWLVDPCVHVSPRISERLQAGLFESPWTLLIAMVHGLMVNIAALAVGGGFAFAWFIAFDAALVVSRMLIFRRLRRNAARGEPTPTDPYLLICIAWSAIQGLMGFCCMRSEISSLQVICSMTVGGLVAPICMRNFGTPRFALLLIGLSLGPLVCGAILTRDHWLLILALQAPVGLFGAAKMLKRIQALTVRNLEAEIEGQERARRDSLTGLLNRAGLADAFAATSVSPTEPLVCLYLDLDGFKAINDVHGHQAGDELLRMVAQRLSKSAPEGCMVARLGGDEFVILAPRLSPEEGQRLASKIVHAISDVPYAVDGSDGLRIGISVGFACAPHDGCEHADLARKADVALYEAKSSGKNTQRRYGPRRDACDHPPGDMMAAE